MRRWKIVLAIVTPAAAISVAIALRPAPTLLDHATKYAAIENPVHFYYSWEPPDHIILQGIGGVVSTLDNNGKNVEVRDKVLLQKARGRLSPDGRYELIAT